MQQAVDISWWQILLFASTLCIPFAINARYKLALGRDAVVGLIRMTLQLALVGLYLEYLFYLNSLVVNLLWLMVMILVGANAIVGKAKLPKRPLMGYVGLGLAIGLFPVIALLCLAIIQPNPFYSAQYVIPLSGMLLGNSLSGNIVALQNFFGSLESRWSEYEASISLGAPIPFATLPFVRVALQKSLAPILATMATTGLVSLPGMMTGQILGGTNPIIAIKYQLIIMIAIFVMMTISITLTLNLVVHRCFNHAGKPEIHFIDSQ
ncbi:ABC transporter permease [Vibrio mediterranei]|uniref:ABC transporter permease n=1 Tax=Vibrio mediterranei TaxID=689 RepID=UPI0040679448